ncbi:NAD(P)H-dependent flavin oxidoreductase [Halomarina pelagica]|uniref:NAD(P)H-dependent flavin oxidoreductase n=1 Tax=Halomarina pelagica TaxID=2961599 RepID=UPI0020C53885|nr:nitronate monooxygenase [Halomarina sp. BND7]
MPPFDTALCRTLDIDHPLVQAPIGSASCPALAAAVSEAGGLGTLAVTWRGLDATRRAIRETRERTDRPFGVNLVLDPATTRAPTEEHLDACLDAGAPVVSLSFGDAAPHVERCREAGATVMQTVGSAEEAREAVAAGVDAVVAQGWEAGGHVQSEVATMPLVPAVADAVPDAPVVAAGGIADGRGLAAALVLGAAGGWLGTRFVAAEEARSHGAYRERVRDADETDTVFSELFDGGWPGTPHRTLRNATVEAWERAGRPPPGERPGEGETVAAYPNGRPVERYGDDVALPGMTGDVEALALYAGQSSGLTNDVRPAAAIVEGIVAEARAALDRASA